MDSLGLWLSECCERLDDSSSNEAASRLYLSFRDWKQARGEAPMSQTRWGEQMVTRGFARYTSNGTRYRGVQLTPTEVDRLLEADRKFNP